MVLEKILESPLDSKEIKPVNPKGNQPWTFSGKTDAVAEAPDSKSWLIRKEPDAEKDWRQKEKRVAEVRWLNSITDSMDMNLTKLQEIVKGREAWLAAVYEVGCKELDTT